MNNPISVIFDSSTFTLQTFSTLEQSALRSLCASGRFRALYPPPMVEETLRAFGSDRKRMTLLNDWLPFIVATTDRFCDQVENIVHRELIQGKGRKTNIFVKPRHQKNLLSNFQQPASDENLEKLFKKTQGARNGMRENREKFHERVKKLRTSYSEHYKKMSLTSWRAFCDTNINWIGECVIRAKFPLGNAKPGQVVGRWLRYKSQYPYSTGAIKNEAYTFYHSVCKPTEQLDKNALADLQILLYLNDADIIVSNDERFMKSAFATLWKPKGKRFMSSREFSEFVNKLYG